MKNRKMTIYACQITTTMKPLPEPDVIPPNGSANYPEAAADRLLKSQAIILF